MLSLKSLMFRLLAFCATYALLLFFFKMPPVQNATADLFSGGAGAIISTALPRAFIHIERVKENQNIVQTMFGNQQRADAQLEEARTAGRASASLDLQNFQIKLEEFFVMPLIFFLALVVITPVHWRRKLVGAAWGTMLILFFCWLKLLCYTLYNFTMFPVGVYELSGFPHRFVTVIYEYIKMGANILFATVVWVLVVFRHSDWKNVLRDISQVPAR